MYDTVNTTTVVVSFWTFVYDMLIYYKTWIYQCLIMQVKSPSICSRVPEPGSDPLIGSGRESGRDKLISEPRFRRFWKCLKLLMYLHRMCWPNADVFVLFIV